MKAISSKSELLICCLQKTADSEEKGRTPLNIKNQKLLSVCNLFNSVLLFNKFIIKYFLGLLPDTMALMRQKYQRGWPTNCETLVSPTRIPTLRLRRVEEKGNMLHWRVVRRRRRKTLKGNMSWTQATETLFHLQKILLRTIPSIEAINPLRPSEMPPRSRNHTILSFCLLEVNGLTK